MDIIVTHTMADFDALASLVAAKKLYPKAQMVLPSSSEQNVRHYLKQNQEQFDFKKEGEIDFKKVTRLIVVDTRLSYRIGQSKKALDNVNLTIHLYDHHPRTEKDLKGKISLGNIEGATTTLLVGKIREKKIKLTSHEATLFALGIYEDTGCFTFATTTAADLKAVSFLLALGADLNIISNFIHQGLSPPQIKLLEKLLHSLEDIIIDNVKITITAVSLPSFKDDLAIIVHKLRDIERIDVLFVLIEIKDRVHLIARAQQKGVVNVGEIMRFFGGGGHEIAASATISSVRLCQVREKLLRIVNEKIKMRKKESIIIKEIPGKTKIFEAEQLFFRTENDLFQINQKKKVIGTIGRSDVEKAEAFGLGNFSVITFMSRKKENFPLTKSFLNPGKKEQTRKNIKDLIKKKLPLRTVNLLKKIGQMGDEMNCPVYIVGGFVWDLFLNVENLDIDVVVEGKSISFARRLARFLKKRISVHTKFSTATIEVEDDLKIDVAMVRREIYEYPGALPQIKSGSLKEDLFRRDFSLNAMAVKLNSKDFGFLIDFFYGEEDMKKGVVRTLYNLSFIEDPTRIFRAIRFEQRYDFCMDENTQHFLRWAVKNDFLKQVSKERIREEIIAILNECAPQKAIKRMAEFKILEAIHPKIKITGKIRNDFGKVKDVLFLFTLPLIEDTVEKWLIYFLVLVQDLNYSDTMQVCNELRFNKRWIKIVLMAEEAVLKIKKQLKKKGKIKPGDIYRVLHQIPNEIILLAMIQSTDLLMKKRISDYLTKMRQLRILITGDDLKKMGYREGRIFKEIKERLLFAKLDKKVKTREEEFKFVIDNFPKD